MSTTGRTAPALDMSDVDHELRYRGCECPNRVPGAIEAICSVRNCPTRVHHLEPDHRGVDFLRYELNHNGLS